MTAVVFAARAAIGALCFGAIQAFLIAFPPETPVPGGNAAWFLDSLTGVLAVAVSFLLLGTVASVLTPASIASVAIPITVGASIPLVASLIAFSGGNLFPFVLLFGLSLIAISTLVGAWAGEGIRTLGSGNK